MGRVARYALVLLALLGMSAGANLSIEHFQSGETCPMLGPIPACFIVFAGYGLISLNAIFASKLDLKSLFFLGWTPILLLAAMGVSLEIFGQDVCPPGAFGIPQCFYSLAMALLCLGLFLILRKHSRTLS